MDENAIPEFKGISTEAIQGAITAQTEVIHNETKIGGFGYWLILGICFGKDIFDGVWAFLQVLGTGMLSTVLGAPVGVLIIAGAWLAGILCSIAMAMLILMYFSSHDAHTGVSYVGKKLGTLFIRRLILAGGLTLFDSVIPGVSIIPITTMGFVIAVILENKIRKGGAIGRATELVVSELSKGTNKRQRFAYLMEARSV